MDRKILAAIGLLHVSNAAWMWIWPMGWYHTIPGVTDTGPFNMHFVKDIGLVFLVCGTGLIWAGLRGDRHLGLWAAAWPCLHALFHIWMWLTRGAPFDFVALSNLLGIQAPAWAALVLLLCFEQKETI